MPVVPVDSRSRLKALRKEAAVLEAIWDEKRNPKFPFQHSRRKVGLGPIPNISALTSRMRLRGPN